MPYEIRRQAQGGSLHSPTAPFGLDLKNGELHWRYPRVSNRTANIATPIVHDGYVFLSSDYGTGMRSC